MRPTIIRTFFVFAVVFFSILSNISFVEAETVSVPASVVSGQSFTVSWTAPAGRSIQDWVSVFAIGAPNTAYNSWSGVPVDGTSGTLTLSARTASGAVLPAGNYEVRYFLDNTFNEPSPPARASFIVTGGAAASCGDTICNGTETTASCPADCPTAASCGDGSCNGTETTASCPADCPATSLCGNGTCNTGETTASCPADCPAPVVIPPPALFFGATPSVIAAGDGATLSWAGSNVSGCVASGSWTGAQANAGSVSFVDMTEGTKTYKLTCDADAGGQIISVANLFVGPAPIPVVFFSATPSSIAAGENTTLSWSSTNAVSCTGSGNVLWGGQNPKPTSGTITFTKLQQTTTYSISCKNKTGQSSAVQSQTVAVGPTLGFTATPPTIDFGAKTLLAWATSPNTTSCTPGGFPGPIAIPTGSTLVLPAKSTIYTLVCKGNDPSFPPATQTASVAVKPVFLKLETNPPNVNTGGSITFTWQASPNAVSCDASGDWKAAGLAISGTKVFSSLTKTQNFSFSCVTADNLLVTSPGVIKVIPTPLVGSFTADKTTINANEPITLTWSVINAVKCEIGGVPEGFLPVEFADGTHSVTISNLVSDSILTLVCGGAFGAAKPPSISVTVIPPPPSDAFPTIMFSADKTTINPGEPVTVTWAVTNAAKCVAGGAVGFTGTVDKVGGSKVITGITDDVILSLDCFGTFQGAQKATKEIPITVNAPILCAGTGICKFPSDTCVGTTQTTADCTGGSLCCVPPAAGSCPGGTCIPGSCGADSIPNGICTGGTTCCVPAGSCTGGTCVPGSCGAGTIANGTCASGTTCCVPGTVIPPPPGMPPPPPPPIDPGDPEGGLVPCGSGDTVAGDPASTNGVAEDCQFEDFITLAKNVMNFLLFTIAIPIAAISFAWAGWLYLSAGGNEGNIKRAHEIFGYVVLGLCVALAAWLIVNAIVIGLGVGTKYNFLGTG